MPIFYDPMISKLIAWDADRPQAIARMRRALREYDVLGIKTTVPFFRWMLEQPDFIAGKFHTAYLDDILRSRAGEPFTSADDERVEVAVIAAAIEQIRRVQKDPPHDSRASLWKQRARTEGLRE